ncbi:hypothetical protein [Nocardiopsis mwathae]
MRPDGFIAWRAAAPSGRNAEAVVEQAFGRALGSLRPAAPCAARTA